MSLDNSTRRSSEEIGELIRRYGAQTILDFGSGSGAQYTEQKLHEEWGVEMPVLYDPAIKGIDKMPNGLRPFDGVICCDVLEHLEGEALGHAIFHATLRARKFAFFSISCNPDRPPDWWRAKIDAHAFKGTEIKLKFDGGDE